jgi:hypothetical protein
MKNNQSSNTITLLSTLHQFHAEIPGYSFEVLAKHLEQLSPDIICAELMPSEVNELSARKIKVEYTQVILPFAQRHGCKIYGMEPEEPKKTALVKKYMAVQEQVQRDHPERTTAFSEYSEALYAYLFSYWTSPETVNSEITDALFEVKHGFQETIFGAQEKQMWDTWNKIFLDTILKANAENDEKHILVTVGAEHRYWLKKALQRENLTLQNC